MEIKEIQITNASLELKEDKSIDLCFSFLDGASEKTYRIGDITDSRYSGLLEFLMHLANITSFPKGFVGKKLYLSENTSHSLYDGIISFNGNNFYNITAIKSNLKQKSVSEEYQRVTKFLAEKPPMELYLKKE